MEDKRIDFVDQTIRDAQQSLWGFRMPTDMVVPIAEVMDRVGFRSIGVPGGRGAVVAIRFLKENLLDRFRTLSQIITKTPLHTSFVQYAAFGFDVEPLAVIELWIRRAVANGIRRFWVCDYQNTPERTNYLVKVAKELGAEVVTSIMYTVSPVHTDELFEQKARIIAETEDMDAIRLEDAGGVLTPERTRTLIPAVIEGAKGLRVEFHAHCNIGLAPASYVEALKGGITTLHTAVAPLANDTSLPSAENTILNARHLGYTVDIDEEALKKMSDHFRKESVERGMRVGIPLEYTVSTFDHQLPGGMTGTLRNQLADIKQEHRMQEVLEEIARVREDFGYPVMATPYSQITGAQALFNVTSGARYRVIPDEVIKFVLGLYGAPDGPIDQNIKDKILNQPKAKKLATWKPNDITIDDLRKVEPGLSDDDLLIRIANPDKEFKNKLNVLYGR